MRFLIVIVSVILLGCATSPKDSTAEVHICFIAICKKTHNDKSQEVQSVENVTGTANTDVREAIDDNRN